MTRGRHHWSRYYEQFQQPASNITDATTRDGLLIIIGQLLEQGRRLAIDCETYANAWQALRDSKETE